MGQLTKTGMKNWVEPQNKSSKKYALRTTYIRLLTPTKVK